MTKPKKTEIEASTAVKRYDLYAKIAKYAAVVLGIYLLRDAPADRIQAIGNIIENILNISNWTVYIVIFFLVIVIIVLWFRNRELTKRLGNATRDKEKDDANNESSGLNAYGKPQKNRRS